MNEIDRIKELTEILNQASAAYYGGQEELMSNFEWDALFDELSDLEKITGYAENNSPTKKVGYTASSEKRERHEYPALSLAKTKDVSELQKWAGEREVWVSWKCDGITLVCTYDDGRLSKILTRGDSVFGNNITDLQNVISGIPSVIKDSGHLVVRGEALITYSDFEEINLTLDDDNAYANPRNLVAGTLALDDPEKVRLRRVAFYAFTPVYLNHDIRSWGERMDYLQSLGFTTVEREKTNMLGLPEVVKRWTQRVESGALDIPVDGLVICYDDTEFAETGSVTTHHATRAGLAFKWPDQTAETVLDHIEWSCAASTITPVAVFDSVHLEGTEVKRASLCNISEMKRLGIGADRLTDLKVVKANMIIPKVIAADNHDTVFDVPEHCPVCQAETEIHIGKVTGTETLHCTNSDCPAKHLQNFTRFVSRYGLDIDGLSIKTLSKFINSGFISGFSDIFKLSDHYDAIKSMEGFGEKSVSNLDQAIQKSRLADAARVIFALGIPMIGVDAGKRIVRQIGFDGFIQRLQNRECFDDIDGIGQERSNSILSWFNISKNREGFEALLEELTVINGEADQKIDGRCQGMTFVITGKVSQFENRDAFKAYVESQGGKVAGSVSAKTDYLINNDVTSDSSKNRKARELNIPILSEEEFIIRFK